MSLEIEKPYLKVMRIFGGKPLRDKGHNLVPEPPQRIIGLIINFIRKMILSLFKVRAVLRKKQTKAANLKD
jgi:hypothetical protein